MNAESHVWITRWEAADRLRLTVRTIDRLIQQGKLTAYQLGNGRVRLRPEDVDAVLVEK